MHHYVVMNRFSFFIIMKMLFASFPVPESTYRERIDVLIMDSREDVNIMKAETF